MRSRRRRERRRSSTSSRAPIAQCRTATRPRSVASSRPSQVVACCSGWCTRAGLETEAAVREHMTAFAYGKLEAVRDPSLALVGLHRRDDHAGGGGHRGRQGGLSWPHRRSVRRPRRRTAEADRARSRRSPDLGLRWAPGCQADDAGGWLLYRGSDAMIAVLLAIAATQAPTYSQGHCAAAERSVRRLPSSRGVRAVCPAHV